MVVSHFPGMRIDRMRMSVGHCGDLSFISDQKLLLISKANAEINVECPAWVLEWLRKMVSPLNKKRRRICLYFIFLPLSLCFPLSLPPSLPQTCTKRHQLLKSLQYITLPYSCLIHLSSHCFHPLLWVLSESEFHTSLDFVFVIIGPEYSFDHSFSRLAQCYCI